MTRGIHHITAIGSDAQKNYDFYTQVLGLRLVKKSVNQDDVSTYHLFYGNRVGLPGMDLTFFIFLPPTAGRRGNGQVTTISLSVPESSLSFWQHRFKKLDINHKKVNKAFGIPRIVFYDPDGQQLELVGVKDVAESSDVWVTKEIGKADAIRHFYGATLSVARLSSIEPVLTQVFGYSKVKTESTSTLFRVTSGRADCLEVREDPSSEFGMSASGTVHHIAFRARDLAEQQSMRSRVVDLGLHPTDVIDRFYFKSVYFRTPAGILFEIATDGPGFTADEKEDELGKKLALPPFLESQRPLIEAGLEPIAT